MDPIDTAAGALAAAIRRQVAALGRTPRASALVGRTQEPTARSGARPARDATGDIAALIARRVQAIDVNDPNRHRKAFRVFLQSVLLAEFGEDLINDAGFQQLVEDVHSDMEADHELAVAIRAATTRLLAPPDRARR